MPQIARKGRHRSIPVLIRGPRINKSEQPFSGRLKRVQFAEISEQAELILPEIESEIPRSSRRLADTKGLEFAKVRVALKSESKVDLGPPTCAANRNVGLSLELLEPAGLAKSVQQHEQLAFEPAFDPAVRAGKCQKVLTLAIEPSSNVL